MVLVACIFAFSIRGNIGLNGISRAHPDSISGEASSIYLRFGIYEFPKGVKFECSLRQRSGNRDGESALSFLTAALSFKIAPIPLSFSFGRQFSYMGFGGLVDGILVRGSKRGWDFEFLGGKKVKAINGEGLFKSGSNNLVALNIRSPYLKVGKLSFGFAKESREGTTFRAPLWANLTARKKVGLRAEVYYDTKYAMVTKLSSVMEGKVSRALRWSFGYRYRKSQEIFKLLGIEEDSPFYKEPKGNHRIEFSLRFRPSSILFSLGSWLYLPSINSSNTIWISSKVRVFSFYGWYGGEERGVEISLSPKIGSILKLSISGRITDEKRFFNTTIKSLRVGVRLNLPLRTILSSEIRWLSNPEIESGYVGYIGLNFPFGWSAL